MQVSSNIRKLSAKNRYSIRQLAELIGVSENGLHKALINNEFKISMLLKISEVLNEPIENFFKEDTGENANDFVVNYNVNGNNVNNKNSAIKTQNNGIKDQNIGTIEKLRIQIASFKEQIDMKNQMLSDREKYYEELLKSKQNEIFALQRMVDILEGKN